MTGSDKGRVLIVDDKIEMARTLADGLADRGYQTHATSSGLEALAAVTGDSFDVVVTDLRMPQVDGLQLLEASRRSDPERPVIMMTAFSAVDTAVESIRRGAYHYLTKPFKLDELTIFIERALADTRLKRETARLRRELRAGAGVRGLVGTSASMHALRDLLHRVGATHAPVLILGETGTGKSVIARSLHGESPRAAQPFVAVNCAALPENLLESELFGHVRGAFTGATASRPGLLVEASGGTLFLDEIGEMAPGVQAKLLHVLEQSTVRPVGSDKQVAVDARIVAATNQDLRQAVKEGTFREDLLYRLDVLSLTAPTLRSRPEDIPELVAHFLVESHARYPGSMVRTVSAEAMAALMAYPWPGNVRELEHLIQRMVVLGATETIAPAELPERMGGNHTEPLSFGDEVRPVREIQQRYATWAVAQFGGNRTQAARALAIDAKTLRSWLDDDKAGGR